MPSPSDVATLRQANASLTARVERDLRGFWSTLDLSRPEAARDALLRFVPVLTTAYGEAAAVVAADWYDDLRATEAVPGRYRAAMVDPVPVEYVQRRTRHGVGFLFTETPDSTLAFLVGAASKYALQPGWDSITRSTAEDPRAVGWHRETRGSRSYPSGCDFCRLLAANGAVYRRESARFAAHDGCGCVAVPSWDADAPEVPVEAYVASERTSRMTPAQRERHRASIRAYL